MMGVGLCWLPGLDHLGCRLSNCCKPTFTSTIIPIHGIAFICSEGAAASALARNLCARLSRIRVVSTSQARLRYLGVLSDEVSQLTSWLGKYRGRPGNADASRVGQRGRNRRGSE